MIQNNMSVRKNKRQARKYPSTDFCLLLCIMLFAGAAFTNPMNELIWKVRGDLR